MTKLFASFDFSKLPRKLEVIDLADYHESLSDQPKITIWVNLTKALFDEWEQIQLAIHDNGQVVQKITEEHYQETLAKTPKGKPVDRNAKLSAALEKRLAAVNELITATNDRVYAWYAEVWSQSADASTHVSAEDVRSFAEQCMAGDPALWSWVTTATQAKIIAYRNLIRKN